VKHVATDAAEPVRSLLGLWNDSHLHAEEARKPATSAVPLDAEAPWLVIMQEILTVSYGPKDELRCHAGQWTRRKKRAAPSAGALYPLELVVSVLSDRAERGHYLYSPERGLLPYQCEPLTVAEAGKLGLISGPSSTMDALVFVVARPWTSMKKYGLRGYLYCHLDAGHAATNIGLYTRALGGDVAVHLRFSRSAVARRLGLTGTCREPLVALSFVRQGPPEARDASMQERRPAFASLPIQLEPPVDEERANWSWFSAVTSFHSSLPFPEGPAASTPLSLPSSRTEIARVVQLTEPPSPMHHPVDVRAAILKRTSAKGFRDSAIDLDDLTALLASLQLDVPTDCGKATPLKVTLVTRAVRDLSPGAWAYNHERAALYRVGAAASAEDFRTACMGQRLAATAAALVLFHGPIPALLERMGFAGLAESHFHAAQFAQRMYLAAARAGVGITCVGGFDGLRLASLGGLPPDEEVIYMAALGVADDQVAKDDALSTAHSHGFSDER
jgi:SagB-type dehydrogenase family enzyme